MREYQLTGEFEQTANFQAKYNHILEECDDKGIPVLIDRIVERDRDIFPHIFYRKGTKVYAFSRLDLEPWEVTFGEDKSHIICPTHNYGIIAECLSLNVENEDKLTGKLTIEYEDAGQNPELKVTVKEGSVLPKGVEEIIEEIFSQSVA